LQTEWVEIRVCAWLHEAQFLKSVLNAAGIEVRIPNEQTLGVQPLYGNLLGGAKILVARDDVERASELLDSAAMPPGNSDEGASR
jgi:hypothetical protein